MRMVARFAMFLVYAAISVFGQVASDTSNVCREALKVAKQVDCKGKTPESACADEQPGAVRFFCVAEAKKRLGDYEANAYYQRAIDADPAEPCYDSFYADYLRSFRGALTPLFPESEFHYFQALKKLASRKGNLFQAADKETEEYVKRGLSALYQQDGVAVAMRRRDGTDAIEEKIPLMFLGTRDRYAQSTADLDREADVRDYTSEAVFAESAQRLNRPLTKQELRGMIRDKKAAETVDVLRFRHGSMPVIDIYYGHRQTDNDQITKFVLPDQFNTLRLSEYGTTVQKPFTIANALDASVSGTFELDQRWGLIEFIPGAEERILNYTAQAAASRFVGPDKVNVQFTYAYQTIHPEVAQAPQPDRHREFVGATATYQLFRPVRFLQDAYDQRIDTRGWDFFAGFLNDTELFPPINVRRHDYFVGTSLKGMANGHVDFTFQPTWFTSSVEGNPSQHNGQYRMNFNTLFRIIDEDHNDGIPRKEPGLHLAFLHIVIPVRYDQAVTGPAFFENYKIGAEVDAKLFTYSRWATFLVSVRYDHQWFFQLDKDARIYSIAVSLGF